MLLEKNGTSLVSGHSCPKLTQDVIALSGVWRHIRYALQVLEKLLCGGDDMLTRLQELGLELAKVLQERLAYGVDAPY